MPNDQGVLREAAWRELFPWLLLFRVVRVANDVRKVLLCAAALFLTAAGWWGIEGALLPKRIAEEEVPLQAARFPWRLEASTAPTPVFDQVGSPADVRGAGRYFVPWERTLEAMQANWHWATSPFRRLFAPGASFREFASAACCAIWACLVWALFAGIVTRIAAIELSLEERVGMRAALKHVRARYKAYFAAPLLPLVLVALAALPVIVLGLLMRLDFGVAVAGVVWPLALVAGCIMALVLLGLLFGWPMMFAAMSVDGIDSFDAISRSYSYVYQRPLQYLFYGVVSLFIGGLCWLVVATAGAVVVELTHWAAGISAGAERLTQIQQASVGQVSPEVAGMAYFGSTMIAFWTNCVRLGVLAYGYAFFWSAATAMYLLLRRDCDANEIDDLTVEETDEEYQLPALKTDAAGVQVLADEPAPS